MGTIGFETPLFFWGLILLAPLVFFYLLQFPKSRRIFAFIASSPGEERALRVRYFFSHLFFLIFLACLFFALAGPRWGSRMVSGYRRGVDLVLAMDLSRSMEVRDSPSPEGLSRLEQARRTAEALVRDLDRNAPGENRFGLVMGKGRGILALPLSYDTEGILALLEALEDSLVTGRGTNLESLIDTASGAFQDALPSRRVILLFSDGEELSGSLSAALERAADRDITVSALGMGTETGGPVPLVESRPQGAEQADQRNVPVDERGFPVISFRRTAALRNIAERTGGIYLDGNREDSIPLLEGYIRSQASETGTGSFRREPRPGWRIFVLGGLFALALSRLAGFKGRFPGNSRGKK
jgi:Ca-activated chloride channel family protein